MPLVFGRGAHSCRPATEAKAVRNSELSIQETEIECYSMKANSRTFNLASSLMNAEDHKTIETLYRFLRFVDDTADRSSDKVAARLRLIALREVFDTASTSVITPRDRVIAEFIDLCVLRSIPKNLVCRFLSAQMQDLEMHQLVNQSQLDDYCRAVAGEVGMMFCYALGVQDRSDIAAALSLGTGMQLTNIARDIGEDFASGFIYLPLTAISKAVLEKAINSGEPEALATLKVVRNNLLKEAERYYDRGLAGTATLPLALNLSVTVAAYLYRQIGRTMIACPFSTKRHVLSRWQILHIVAMALCHGCLKTLSRLTGVSGPYARRSVSKT